MTTVRVVCLSDTHHKYNQQPKIPEGDILLHAGDFTVQGSAGEIAVFDDYLEQLDFATKIVVPGNHDLLFEKDWEHAKSLLPAADFILNSQEIEAHGLHIYGEPRQPWFYDWAFNVHRDKMHEVWAKIPTYRRLDILVTHGPPYGVCDLNPQGQHVGCAAQREWIEQYQPRLVVCGHLHSGYGIAKIGNTTVINAAICNEQYQPINQPIVIDLTI